MLRLLARAFGDGEGNLYEGSTADFREYWVGLIEKRNNDDDAPLEGVTVEVSSAAGEVMGTTGADGRVSLENVVIDNYIFGVASVSTDGYESPVVFPGATGSFGEIDCGTNSHSQ